MIEGVGYMQVTPSAAEVGTYIDDSRIQQLASSQSPIKCFCAPVARDEVGGTNIRILREPIIPLSGEGENGRVVELVQNELNDFI